MIKRTLCSRAVSHDILTFIDIIFTFKKNTLPENAYKSAFTISNTTLKNRLGKKFKTNVHVQKILSQTGDCFIETMSFVGNLIPVADDYNVDISNNINNKNMHKKQKKGKKRKTPINNNTKKSSDKRRGIVIDDGGGKKCNNSYDKKNSMLRIENDSVGDNNNNDALELMPLCSSTLCSETEKEVSDGKNIVLILILVMMMKEKMTIINLFLIFIQYLHHHQKRKMMKKPFKNAINHYQY